jgi:Nuclease-related domain/TadE-like protein
VTDRVYECRSGPVDLERASPRPRERRQPEAPRGFLPTLLTALLVVPLAGAADKQAGLFVAASSAFSVLMLFRVLRGRVPWGWLSLLSGTVGLFAPREQFGALGTGLFVVTILCFVLWLANHRPSRERGPKHPPPGSPERKAQLLMGFSGERHVGAVLALELPQAYAVLNGLKLPRGAGDIDHLVVGPTGVFVLETKTMAGHVVCAEDGTWSRTRLGRAGTRYPAYIGDPAAQAQRNIMALRNYLRQRLPMLFEPGRGLWIEGLLVFPHPRTELDTEHSPIQALRLEDVSRHIASHSPRRLLQAPEVDAVVSVLVAESQGQPQPMARSAQALVEIAIGLPLVLGLLFGTVALSRILQAQTAVVALVHEVARAGALANSATDARARMQHRLVDVAPGLGLDAGQVELECDVSQFARRDGRVVASASYTVDLGNLPFVDWLPPPAVRAEHVEWVDPFRAGIPLPLDGASTR